MNVKLPSAYCAKMQALLQEEYPAYLASLTRETYKALRVNELKITSSDFQKLCPAPLSAVPWLDNAFFYDPEAFKASKHPYYAAGLYYLQEASAMTPAALLPIALNDYVLDACAAPGGKSTAVAAKLADSGLLVANDISPSRSQALVRNIESAGITNALVSACDLKAFGHLNNFFDKILVDAPCSGEGMFQRDKQTLKHYDAAESAYYAVKQKELLEQAYYLLKEGGLLCYSTCTFSPLENEEVIQAVLNNHPDLKLSAFPKRYAGFSPGLNGLKDAIRIYPHKMAGEGHFIALLQKGEKKEKKVLPLIKCPYPQFDNAEINDFLRHLKKDFYNGKWQFIHDKLFFTPFVSEAFNGLRILRSGLLLGELKNKHFTPSYALALALKEAEFSPHLSLKVNDIRTEKYLKGETLDVSDLAANLDGWCLVTVEHFPLGFAKIKDGILKNKYPPNRLLNLA